MPIHGYLALVFLFTGINNIYTCDDELHDDTFNLYKTPIKYIKNTFIIDVHINHTTAR